MNIYETITNRIIDSLEKGVIPWRKQWKVSAKNGGAPSVPYNVTNGKRYRGINEISLLCSGYSSSGWCTYKQAQTLGYQVRKGERSSPVVWWSFPDRTKAEEKDRAPFAKFYSVFNVEQMDGVPGELPLGDDAEPFDAIESAETLANNYMMSASHPTLGFGGSDAYFRPSTDHVQMPPRESFTSPENYYSVLFHEFVHSTGIKSRLGREELASMVRFGDREYSKEELTAEFGAAFLCGEAGISNDGLLDNSTAYIQNWIAKLQSDKNFAVQAAQRAQKAADFILGRSWKAAEETTAE
jgi:antirestriction protein ArdC